MGGSLSYRLKLVRHQVPNITKDTLPKYVTRFSYKSLRKATNNFTTIVSRNGSSSSYKGTFDDGSKVIVKVYRSDPRYIDFTSMINIMYGVKHQNIVELIGYCTEGDRQILVHEYVGDYSLNQFLFSDSHVTANAIIDWPKRVFICDRIARALEYLHCGISPCVVNRDVKPGNVFMDLNLNPKIVDFEGSSLLEEDESYHSVVSGTMRYMDPEYFLTGRFSEKTDVYAFGVTVLEIIAGRKNLPYDPEDTRTTSLLNRAWELRESGRILEIVGPNLSEFSEDEVIRLVNVALSCVQLSPVDRPSMSEVRVMLSNGYDFSNMVLSRPREYWQISSDDDEPMESGQISSDDGPTTVRPLIEI